MIENNTLWSAIQHFEMDDPKALLPFSKKLAKENCWPEDFTRQAIDEYKKFIFLCCTLPNGASPSPIVDIVWHQHLIYTENYWNRFCKQTLKKDIHHYPSLGGETENQKHKAWYEETLLGYVNTFKTIPPTTIWNYSAEQQERLKAAMPYTLKQGGWALSWFKYYIPFVAILGINLLLFQKTNPFLLKGTQFLIFFPILFAFVLLSRYLVQLDEDNATEQNTDDISGEKISIYELAFLTGGKRRCFHLLLAECIDKALLIPLEQKQYTIDKSQEIPNNPLAFQLVKYPFNDINVDSLFDMSYDYLSTLTTKYKDVNDKPDLALENLHPVIIFVLVGLARILQGISNDKPVAYLAVELFIGTFLYVLFSDWISKTHTYEQYASRKIASNKALHFNDSASNPYQRALILEGIVAIAGISTFTHLETVLTNTPYPMHQKNLSNGGSSSGGSCGSSGCGSSCGGGCGGGCGGCGS
jgi:hypothetical protein